MKTELEIERAHDLVLVTMARYRNELVDHEKCCVVMGVALDVLCWVLNHDSDDNHMAKLMASFEELFRDASVYRITEEELRKRLMSALVN